MTRRWKRIARGYRSPYREAGIDADMAREDRRAELLAAHQLRLGREGGRKPRLSPTPALVPASAPDFRTLGAERYESKDPFLTKTHAGTGNGCESLVPPRTLSTPSCLTRGENLRPGIPSQNAATDGSEYSLASRQATVGSTGATSRHAAMPETGIKNAHNLKREHFERP